MWNIHTCQFWGKSTETENLWMFLKSKSQSLTIWRHFDSWLKQNLRVWTVYRVDKSSLLRNKEQLNASCNHQKPSAIILKYKDALILSTWFYHATLLREECRRVLSRARGLIKFYSFRMIRKRKITMWRNFLSVWFFLQHERWAFI